MLTPLLKKIGISLRFLDDAIHRIVLHEYSLVFGGLANCDPCCLRIKRTNRRKVEKPLRVRLRSPHAAPDLRKSRANHRDGHPSLRSSMKRSDQGSQLGLCDILQFVDEKDERRAGCLGRGPGNFQQ